MQTISHRMLRLLATLILLSIAGAFLSLGVAYAAESPKGTVTIESEDGRVLASLDAYLDSSETTSFTTKASSAAKSHNEAIVVNEVSDTALLGNLRVATFDVSVDLNAVSATLSETSTINENWINYWVKAYYQTQGDDRIKITRVASQFKPATLNFYWFEGSTMISLLGSQGWSYAPGGRQYSQVSMDQYTDLTWDVWAPSGSSLPCMAEAITYCLVPPTQIERIKLSVSVNCQQ